LVLDLALGVEVCRWGRYIRGAEGRPYRSL